MSFHCKNPECMNAPYLEELCYFCYLEMCDSIGVDPILPEICYIQQCYEPSDIKGLCRRHYYQKRNQNKTKKEKKIGAIGKGSNGYLLEKTEDGWKLHHRCVMERHLKRDLKSDESISHVNGNKFDNEISNLKLKCGLKPKSTSVEDLLKWAKSMQDRYKSYKSATHL